MISLRELRAMLKENNIRGCLHYNKPELVDVLVKRGLIPEIFKITTSTSLPERKDTKKEINPKYNTYAIVQSRLRFKIWKLVKLLYILLCIRLLRDLINSLD